MRSLTPLPNPDAAISVRGLTKRFGDFTAVDGIDFDVAKGEIFGFLGPNGAGKTTAIRMLTGALATSGGAALVAGEDVIGSPELVKRRIGYMSQKFSLFEDMTVDENLRFYAGVYDLAPKEFAEQRAYVLKMADLEGREDELTRDLSVGWKQRLALGTATIHRPELLFLDEPTSGVDPVARRQFWELLYDMAARGVTLFVTTHYMEEASHCHRLAFIYRGRLIAAGSPHEIRTEYMRDTILEIETPDAEKALTWLEGSTAVREVYASGASLHAVVARKSDDPGSSAEASAGHAEQLARLLREAGIAVDDVHPVEPSIEDVFVNLASAQKAGEPQ